MKNFFRFSEMSVASKSLHSVTNANTENEKHKTFTRVNKSNIEDVSLSNRESVHNQKKGIKVQPKHVTGANKEQNADKNRRKREPSVDRVIHITNLQEYSEFKKRPRGVIFYGAKWCKACKQIEPLYNRIGNRYHKQVALAHVDVDVANLEFSAVPVFVAMRNGKQIDSLQGSDKEGLKELIKKAIKSP